MKNSLESQRARPTQDAQLQLARTTLDPYAKRTDAQSKGQVWFVPGYSSPVKVERAFKLLVNDKLVKFIYISAYIFTSHRFLLQ